MAMARPLRSVAIIGGGIGGLVLAHALKAGPRALEVAVYERDADALARGQGYDIGLNKEGLGGLDAIATPALTAFLNNGDLAIDGFAVTTAQLSTLVIFGGTRAMAQRSALVNRSELREVLAQGVDVRWNKRFVSYRELGSGAAAGAGNAAAAAPAATDAAGVEVQFEDGTTITADLVVGADGARSGVRAQRCPALQVAPVGAINSVGKCPTFPTAATHPTLFAVVSRNMMRVLGDEGYSFLLIPHRIPGTAATRELLWVLTQPDGPTAPTTAEGIYAHAADVARRLFHPEVADIITRSSPSDILVGFRNLVTVVPTADNILAPVRAVTLLGDAAHPMTTHAGLGANTAIVDAMDLAKTLQEPDWLAALAAYDARMLKRGFANATQSLNSTKMLTSNAWTVKFSRVAFMWSLGWVMSFLRLVSR